MKAELAPLRLVCCVCDTVMREGREPVSHGYCPACSARAMEELRHTEALYFGSSSALRRSDFPISGAGRSAGDISSGQPAMGCVSNAKRTAEAVSP